MTKPVNTAAIEKSTGKSWQQWVDELDAAGARQLNHTELARLVNTMLGDMESQGWWAQGVTVAYEQHIGRRVPGQLADGKFEIATSKTIPRSRDKLFSQVVEWFESQTKLNSQEFSNPRSSQTPKRSNWRCDFSGGSKFAATVEGDEAKAKLVLSHTAIPTKKEADNWKAYWQETAGRFAT